jgi:hypothetical protein
MNIAHHNRVIPTTRRSMTRRSLATVTSHGLRKLVVLFGILLSASRAAAQSDAANEARTAVLKQDVARRFGQPTVYALMTADRTPGVLENLRVDLKVGDMVLIISDFDGFVAFGVSADNGRFMRAGPGPGDKQRNGYGESSTRIQNDIVGSLLLGGTGGVAHVFIIPRANLR